LVDGAWTQFAELTGAEGALCAARIAPSMELVAAGDWRGNLLVWSATSSASASASRKIGHAAKRARAGSASDAAGSGSVGTLAHTSIETRAAVYQKSSAHSTTVTGVTWISSGSVASASWDQSIRVWDVEADCAETVTLFAPHAINAITSSPMGSLIATGHSNHAVRVWDSRGRSVDDGTVAVGGRVEGLRATMSHGAGWVAAVAWSPVSSYHLASASHDGDVALWDIRAPSAPLFELQKHAAGEKALCVAWAGATAEGVASGGSDKQLHTSRLTSDLA
ncbi:hypothetical protein EON67_09975, partial [archaeon]